MEVALQAEPLIGGERAWVPRPRRGASARALPALRMSAAESLAAWLAVPLEELLEILYVTGRTAQRRRQTGVLSAEESDRLVRAAHLVRRAIDTFGDEAVARSWLMRPNRALGARRPLDLLGSELEAVAVEATLGRVEFGDFS